MDNLEQALEAILFAHGDGISLERISGGLNLTQGQAEAWLERLTEKYKESGIQIIQVGELYQMATNPAYYPYVERFIEKKSQSLTKAQLETLSIIAYKQPITKADIEQIRGVDSSSHINKLIQHGLIAEQGRVNAPGRPILFVTTDEFLRQFSMKKLDDLPAIE